MTEASKLAMRHVNNFDHIPKDEGLILAIRTDASHATRGLKERIKNEIATNPDALPSIPLLSDNQKTFNFASIVDDIVHRAYQRWGHKTLGLLSETIDYGKYGIQEEKQQKLSVHFYDSKRLAGHAIELGRNMTGEEPVLIGRVREGSGEVDII